MRQLSRISLRDILYLLARDRMRILLIVLVAFVGACIYLAFESSIYLAESRVLVRIGKEKMSGIESMTNDSHNILFQERPPDIHNGLELLRDPELSYTVYQRLEDAMVDPAPPTSGLAYLRYVVKDAYRTVKETLSEPLYWFGFSTRLSRDEKLVRALAGSLKAEVLEDTDVIKLTFAWPDPEFAALAANTYAEELLVKYIKVHGSLDSEKFYVEQLRVQEQNLEKAEAALQSFRNSHDITSLQWQKETLLREVSDAQTRLNENAVRLAEARSVLAAVSSSKQRNVEWIPTPEVRQRTVLDLSSLDRQYYELTARRAQLASTQRADSPELVQLAQRIAQMREQKFDGLERYFKLTIDTAQVESQELEKQIETKRARLNELNRQTGPLAELERARATAEQNLTAYQKKSEELRVSDLLSDRKFSGLRIVSASRPPLEPAYPRKFLILGLALGIGLFLALTYSAIAEYFNHTFREGADVEQILGKRLLMSIPLVTTRSSPSSTP